MVGAAWETKTEPFKDGPVLYPLQVLSKGSGHLKGFYKAP